MYLKKVVVLGVTVLLFLVSVGITVAQEALPDLSKSYTDEDEGFSISYPEGWVEGEPGDALAWIHDTESSELVVLKDELEPEMQLSEYVDAINDWAKENLPDYKEESLEKYAIGNEPSMLRVYTFTYKGEKGDVPIKSIEAYLVREGYGYTIICDTEQSIYPSKEVLFKKIIDSFRFIEQ
jgi:hypothetical protein